MQDIVKYHNNLNKIKLPAFTELEQNLLFTIIARIREWQNNETTKDLDFVMSNLYTLFEKLEYEYNIDMNDYIVEKYPFDKDYLEMISQVFEWTENIRGNLENLK